VPPPNKRQKRINLLALNKSINKHNFAERVPAQRGPRTYGELMPKGTECLAKTLKLTTNSTFLDIGSGLGNVVLGLARLKGCIAIGVELDNGLHEGAKKAKEEMIKKATRHNDKELIRKLKKTSFFNSSIEVFIIPPETTAIFINNLMFETELNLKIINKLKQMKYLGKIATLVPLTNLPRRNGSNTVRNLDDYEKRYSDKTVDSIFPADCFSWKPAGGSFYVTDMSV
jgi:[histone H3]-lysine79 N-trimethyltransferase